MTGQTALDFASPAGFTHCADWCQRHKEATSWIVSETRRINRQENRKASMRLDIEPMLKRRSREWGLDDGTYSGIDHNLTADLARYLMSTRPGVDFRIRAKAGEPQETPRIASPV